jgi:hypothetical protein
MRFVDFVPFVLPLFLAYLLMGVSLIERRAQDPGIYLSPFAISLRDSILVVLALDLSELSDVFPDRLFDENLRFSIVVVMLIALHGAILLYILGKTNPIRHMTEPPTFSILNIVNLYFALIVLCTNATTVRSFMDLFWKMR